MIFILIPLILSVVFLLCWGWVKLVKLVFDKPIKWLDAKTARLKKTDNPYIMQHRVRHYNDKMYDEYLEWMEKHNHGLPVDKILTKEEARFEREMKNVYK